MSFLIETTARRMATMRVPVARAAVASTTRPFSTTLASQKSPTETVKDAAKTVDRAVSDKIVDGINLGSKVAQKAKEVGNEAVHSRTAYKASGKAEELKGQAKGTAHQAAGKAEELKGQAKGTADQIKKNL